MKHKRDPAAEAFLRGVLLSNNPRLKQSVPGEKRAGAENLKRLLEWCFPGLKLKFDEFDDREGNVDVEVAWLDGPRRSEVRDVAMVFQVFASGNRNDQTRREETAWMRTFGTVGRIFFARSASGVAIQESIRALGGHLGGQHAATLSKAAEVPADELTVEMLRQTKLKLDGVEYPLLSLALRQFEDTSWPVEGPGGPTPR